jgi:peptidoglycan/LPS O-acetylase OafA/YrhL
MANGKDIRPTVAGKQSRYISELDSLRCIAILTVLAVHFQPPNQPILRWMSFGWVGVDVFFVISGYLITTILLSMRGNTHPYRTFYWRRIIRIFPIYYGYIALVALATHGEAPRWLLRASLFLTSIPLDSTWPIGARLFHHMSFAVPLLPIRDHLFSSAGDGLAMVWSLSIEELFYLFWAPIVLRGSRRLVTACAVLPILVCPVMRGLVHTSTYPEYFRFLFRIDSLMFGAIVGLLYVAIKEGRLRKQIVDRLTTGCLWIPPLILLPMAARGLFQNIELRSTYSFAIAGYSLCGLLFAGIVSWCVANANSPSLLPAILRNPVTTYIGKISYGMYLIHIYAFVALLHLVRHFRGAGWMPGTGAALLATLLTVGLATLSWRFIETPILKLKDIYFQHSQPRKSAEPALLIVDARRQSNAPYPATDGYLPPPFHAEVRPPAAASRPLPIFQPQNQHPAAHRPSARTDHTASGD